MTWKPTEVMITTARYAWFPSDRGQPEIRNVDQIVEAAICAVQPLIAQEAIKNYAATSLRTPELIALVERERAEARAKALEEAAAIAFNRCHDPDNSFELLDAIRALIPKPQEGT